MLNSFKVVVKDEIKEMLGDDIIKPSMLPYASPIMLVKKNDGSNRFCCDFRKLNLITVPDAEPIPDQKEIFAKLAKDTYFTKLDLVITPVIVCKTMIMNDQ